MISNKYGKEIEKGLEGYKDFKNMSKEEQQAAVEQTKKKAKDFAKKEKENYKNFKNLTTKQKLIRIAVPVLVLIILVNVFGGSRGNTVAFKNDTGAVFNMSLDDFSNRLNQALDDSSEYLGKGKNQFEIDSYWNNRVEPMDGTEENSGAKFTTYTAFVDSVVIAANIQDGKLASAKCSFSEYEMGSYFGTHIAMALGGLDVEEASEIIDTIADGAENNTMIYKDGILYSLIPVGSTDLAWDVIAASDDFVSKLEDSGSCNVLRW